MDTDKLLASLDANAERVRPPITVEVPHVGTMYVRVVTIEEFENLESAEGGSAIARGLSRNLCDESGARLKSEVAERFAEKLAKQPREVMDTLIAAMRGDTKKGGDAGN